MELISSTVKHYEASYIEETQKIVGSLMASNNLFNLLLDLVRDKYPHLSFAGQQIKVMELFKEQFMASQINDSQVLGGSNGVLCIDGESQDPYEDEDEMSTSSIDNMAEPVMEDFFNAFIQVQFAKWKGKAKAKDA